ncbi:MAG: hypothetical protein PVF58_13490 [Candidatus Methanofastidiosia archaeon]|jgi:hypothetical protein
MVGSRTSCTTAVIEKAYARKVIIGPFLFVNSGIEVNLLHDIDNPLQFFEKCKKNERTTFAVISHGHWPILWCKKGANTLQYHDSILPSRNNGPISDRKVDKIFFDEKGTLPLDNTIILFLCISPTPRAQNHITGKFNELEEIG